MVCELSEVDALSVMSEASDNWMARCGTWEEPIARHVYAGMRKAGLSAAITPAANEEAVDEEEANNERQKRRTSEDDRDEGLIDEDVLDPRPRYLDGSLIEKESDLPGWYQ